MQTDPPGAAVQWKHAGLVLFLSLALYWGQQVRIYIICMARDVGWR
jgi:hypothetical protein